MPASEAHSGYLYGSPTRQDKSAAHADTYHGRFIELVTNERVTKPGVCCRYPVSFLY